jgi:hypothetical protein
MCKLLILSILPLSLVASSQAQPRAIYRSTIHRPAGSEIVDVAMQGTNLYVATGFDGLWVYDISDDTAPRLLGSAPTLNGWWSYTAIALESHYAYVSGNGLCQYDISDPAHPVGLVWTNRPYNQANGVAVQDGYVYLGDTGDGLRIFADGDPRTVLGHTWRTNIDTYVERLTLADHYVYLPSTGFVPVVDVANPFSPQVLGIIPTAAVEVAVKDHYLFSAAGRAGLETWDVSDPANAVKLATTATPDQAQAIALSGNYAYVGVEGIYIYDVSNPLAPRLVTMQDTGGGLLTHLKVYDNHAFAGKGSSIGIYLITDVPPPVLEVAPTATNTLVVGWESIATNWVLQECSSLATNQWSPVRTAPSRKGTRSQTVLSRKSGNNFLRLAW